MKFKTCLCVAACAAFASLSTVLLAQNDLSSAPVVGVPNAKPLPTLPAGGAPRAQGAQADGQGGRDGLNGPVGRGGGQGGQGQHGNKLEKLARALGLTQEQKSALRPIMQQRHSAMMAIRENNSLSPRQKHEEMKQLRRSTQEQGQQ